MQLKPKHLFPALIATCLSGTSGNAQTNTSQPTASGTPEQTEIVQPPWEVCNETSFILKLATASVGQGMQGTPLSVQGWQTLRPGACQTMNVEKGTPRFVYAQSSNVHQGDIREWKGTHEYCVDAGDFTAKTDLSCALQNLTTKQFLRIIPTEHRTTFVEPDDFRKNAATAGIQRLLRDNNYEVSRIDGVSGRRTNNTLKKFISDKKLGSNLDDDAKFAALEEHAKIAMSDVGLNICNKSGRRVWTAIAFNNGEEMESRGWWSIDVDDCKRIYSKNLIKSDLHFYARQRKRRRRRRQ